MIDKEKLIAAIHKESTSRINRDFYCNMVKNFPEEQPIDFDTLYGEYYDFQEMCNKTITNYGFRDFLKSKNLTAQDVEQKTICAVCGETKYTPLSRNDMGGYVCLRCIDFELTKRKLPKPVDVPVKKTYRIKENYRDFCLEFAIPFSDTIENVIENDSRLKFYDQREEPDYSKISKGSIVEFINKVTKQKFAAYFISLDNTFINSSEGSFKIDHHDIRIVELAKE